MVEPLRSPSWRGGRPKAVVPRELTRFLRDLRCWYAIPGSEPGGRWFDFNSRSFTEVIRQDEEPVLKTGGGASRLRVRVSRLPLTTHGLIVQQEDIGFARRRFGCNSRWVHSNSIVLWPSGEGSSLTKSGSWVRVPPGLLRLRQNAQIRQLAKRLDSGSDAQRWSPSVCRSDSCSGYERTAR